MLSLFVFVVFVLVSSVPRQEIGQKERLQNDLFCVELDVKPQLNHTLTFFPFLASTRLNDRGIYFYGRPM